MIHNSLAYIKNLASKSASRQSENSEKKELSVDLVSDSKFEINKIEGNDKQSEVQNNLVLTKETSESWRLVRWLKFNSRIPHTVIESKFFECLTNKINLEFKYVYIKNGTQRLWTAMTNLESPNTPVVLIHGLCGAMGLWTHNIDKFCASNPLYAIDLLGFGRSSRPKFSNDPILAETEFIEAIEEWRQQLGLEKMILVGHSFGGFLITSYALRYSKYVKGLVLVDPWGFYEKDLSVQRSVWFKVLLRVSQYMSPFSIVRVSGPFGVNLMKRYRPDLKIKFISIFGESDLIYEYIYHANRESPSGECGFRTIADEVFHYAKRPMIKRIQDLDSNIPVWFIHGKNSSVDKNVGYFVKILRSKTGFVSVKVIENAGHHVYADQPDTFNQHVLEIINFLNSF